MTITVWIKYEEAYIPERCRKPRYKECEGYINAEIKEISFNELQLAFEDNSHGGKGKIYYNEETKSLWTKAVMRDICGGGELEHGYKTPLEALVWWSKNGSKYFSFETDRKYYGKDTSRENTITTIEKDMSKYIIVDGELYIKTSLPVYVITTFGTDGDGTELFVEYNKTADNEYCFDLKHTEEAVNEAKATALRHGDYDDIDTFKPLVEVYMPELI